MPYSAAQCAHWLGFRSSLSSKSSRSGSRFASSNEQIALRKMLGKVTFEARRVTLAESDW